MGVGELTHRASEVNGDERAEVALGVLVGIVVAGEPLARVVLDRADVFDVRWILPLARDPDCVELHSGLVSGCVRIARRYDLTSICSVELMYWISWRGILWGSWSVRL